MDHQKLQQSVNEVLFWGWAELNRKKNYLSVQKDESINLWHTHL